jgi:hypothetical protein
MLSTQHYVIEQKWPVKDPGCRATTIPSLAPSLCSTMQHPGSTYRTRYHCLVSPDSPIPELECSIKGQGTSSPSPRSSPVLAARSTNIYLQRSSPCLSQVPSILFLLELLDVFHDSSLLSELELREIMFLPGLIVSSCSLPRTWLLLP